jgi:Na+/proline symporter
VFDGLAVAEATGRLQTFDFSFDLTNQYTFWSGTIAAFFLFCSYFGTDQSQVQRYLTAKSENEAKHSLLMSAYWKIPLQFLVLVVGILVFAFYLFTPPPLLFNPAQAERLRAGGAATAYSALQSEFAAAFESRRAAASALIEARETGDQAAIDATSATMLERETALRAVKARATALVRQELGDSAVSDTNYIIPTFILQRLPIGIIGLIIVAIVMAATDTIAAELNSLSSATVIDFYRRHFRPDATDTHYLTVSKISTGVWGLFACGVAVWAAELGSLIEVVNRFGSYFYGSILGVFVLAIGYRRATGTAAFVGLLAGMGSVACAAAFTNLAFLWHNVVGTVAVFAAGVVVTELQRATGQRK